MTDSIKSWIQERRAIHGAATEGPWYKTPNDRILSESVQWPEGDDYDVAGGFGRKGAVVEAIHDFDGNAIVDAHDNLPRALDALNAVLELHRPYEWSFGYGPVYSCTECSRLGGNPGKEQEAEWPCATAQAIEGAINHE